MDGRWLGVYNRSIGLNKLRQIFHKNFELSIPVLRDGTSLSEHDYSKKLLQGLCLGIAGDTNPNVLWRLMHGEMPPDFHPKIWWLSLGMNDLTRTKVS
jgi:hypothetical protein